VIRRRKRLAGLLVAAAILVPAGGVTYAAYVATTGNSGNRIEAGSVKLDDDDAGAAMLTLANAQPGATDTGCIKVTFNGSLASTVRLYGTTGGTGLDPYLDLRVTRGSNSPSDPGFDSCANFQPDATDYIGAGSGVVYEGTLQGYPDNYAAGQVDPTAGSPETWTSSESHVYKIEVTQRFNPLANGLNATQSFTWEARNQ
jgi:predicted dehydrogenase